MKPLKVEFQAFGPYAGYEQVDFETIASKGLFLICGKTGTGKTMILDAMTFALYGKSSGSGRDDFSAMRCTNASDETPTFVKFEFENNGKYYLFERRLEKKKKNLAASYNVMERVDGGSFVTLFENAKEKDLNAKAVEIIGLDYAQFVQVIVLPQGKFEKLLTSGSDEKEKILTSIFGEDKWQAYASYLYDEVYERSLAIKAKKDRISGSLNEEQCTLLEELFILINQKEQELASLESDFKKENNDRIIEEQTKILALAKRFQEFERDCKTRENEVNSAKISFDKAQEESKRALESIKDFLERLPEIEEKRKLLAQYEAKRPVYESIDEVDKELQTKIQTEKRNRMLEHKAKDVMDELSEEILTVRKAYEDANEAHDTALNAYLAGITGDLAENLREGEPCPVCGSVNHPKKAVRSDNYCPKEQVEEKKALMERIYGELSEKTDGLEKAKIDYEEKRKVSEESFADVKAVEAKLSEMKGNLADGIDSLAGLNKVISNIETDIKNYDTEKVSLDNLEKECKIAEAESVTKHKHALEELKLANERLSQAKEEFKNQDIPEVAVCETRIKEANDRIKLYSEKKGSFESNIERLKKKAEIIENEGKDIELESRQIEADLQFAKKLRGDTGTGLQRYVLGIMFSSVISAANKMLEMVHGGRYRLYRSDDKAHGSNKRGLELKVFDRYSEEHDGRFVSTLSGGEKFLASLALSIGMSTVAQKSGIRIEALFIDEGFGSLDEDSIGDAMNILNSIQEANGLVGIISHVQILQDRIPTKLQVTEKEKGSTIVQTIG